MTVVAAKYKPNKKKEETLPVVQAKKTWYNSHGYSYPWTEFIETEVDDRQNTTLAEANEWKKKYNIKDDDQLIWVTDSAKMAMAYEASPESKDDAEDDKISVAKFSKKWGVGINDIASYSEDEGFIIPESDDGDGGFLFVLKRPEEKAKGGEVLSLADANPKYNPERKEATGDYLKMAKVTGDVREYVRVVKKYFEKYKPEILAAVIRRVPYAKISDIKLYGSVAEGRAKRDSDIDMLVEYDEIKDGYTEIDIQDDLYGKIKIPYIDGALDIGANKKSELITDADFQNQGQLAQIKRSDLTVAQKATRVLQTKNKTVSAIKANRVLNEAALHCKSSPTWRDKYNKKSSGGYVESNLSPEHLQIAESREFRLWFGDWLHEGFYSEVTSKRVVSISKVNHIDIHGFYTNSQRNKYFSDLAKEIKNNTGHVDNEYIGRIKLATKGIHHSFEHVSDIVLQSCYKLDILIYDALKYDTEPNHDPDTDPDTVYYVYLLNVVSYQDENYFFRASIKYSKGHKGYILHDYNLEKIKKPIVMAVRPKEGNPTIADWQHKDEKIILLHQTISENISKERYANGEPMSHKVEEFIEKQQKMARGGKIETVHLTPELIDEYLKGRERGGNPVGVAAMVVTQNKLVPDDYKGGRVERAAIFWRSLLEGTLPDKAFPLNARGTLWEFKNKEYNIRPIPLEVSVIDPNNTVMKVNLLKNIISKDRLRPELSGVYYDKANNLLVASDGAKLVMLDDKKLSKAGVYNIKTGEKIKGVVYPAYQMVIPKDYPVHFSIDTYEWLFRTNGIVKANHFVEDKSISKIYAGVKIGNDIWYFEPEYLHEILLVFAKMGVYKIECSLPDGVTTKGILMKGNGVSALVMPRQQGLQGDEYVYSLIYSKQEEKGQNLTSEKEATMKEEIAAPVTGRRIVVGAPKQEPKIEEVVPVVEDLKLEEKHEEKHEEKKESAPVVASQEQATKVEQNKPTVVNNATANEDNTYISQSQNCNPLDTIAPKSLRYEMLKAIETVDRKVDGVDAYVAEKLNYVSAKCDMEEAKAGMKCLCDALGAEQVDAIAVAIYNIENKGDGTIIGDSTGIGKGRQAAGMLRYAKEQGYVPIFFTAAPNLFSDMARDLIAIGSDDGIPLERLSPEPEIKTRTVTKAAIKLAREEALADGEDPDEAVELLYQEAETATYEKPKYIANKNYEQEIRGKKRFVPFIINAPDQRTAVQDESGNILYRPMPGGAARNEILASGKLPKGYDCIFSTYSQVNSSRAEMKRQFLLDLAPKAIIVLDEAHLAAGESNTGKFFKELLEHCKGVVFLSATFAKRPDNMPLYATKTVIREAQLSDSELIDAVKKGGVALQEILAAQLTREGEMLRRERSYEGIEVNYTYLNDTQGPEFNLAEQHKAIADRATELLRDIMAFQENYVKPAIEVMDEKFKTKLTKGTQEGGISNVPVFNGIFQLVTQLLFSIKAEAVAKKAIQRLKEGKKPVIAFASTMESFLSTITNEDGEPLKDGDIITDDFSAVFKRRLHNCMKYTVENPDGTATTSFLNPETLSEEFNLVYNSILRKIEKTVVGISLSPIDVLYYHIQNAGYTIEEITGRKKRLKILGDGQAIFTNRVYRNAKDTFRMFNDNEIDCIMINQSGAIGASAHAVPTKKVPRDKVKQRCMIILQAELDINKEVQKRGRINRTGQIYKPIYDYVISAIPAEERFMMMLQKKLKSLDANTTSNQKQSSSLLSVNDFLNKYGDRYVYEWLVDHRQINNAIGDPLKLEEAEKDQVPNTIDAALRVSGRVAILSTADQTKFYEDINKKYASEIAYMKQTGEYDLEVEYSDLEAETLNKMIVASGTETGSVFSRHAIMEKCLCNNLTKPYKAAVVSSMIDESLKDEKGNTITADQYAESIIKEVTAFHKKEIEVDAEAIKGRFKKEVEGLIASSPKGENDPAIKAKKEELELKLDNDLRENEDWENSQLKNKVKMFEFFKIGRVIAWPLQGVNEFVRGIFIGFQINRNERNPFTPSNILLKFALASSERYRAVPFSKVDVWAPCRDKTRVEIDAQESTEYMLKIWNKEILSASADKIERYIVTGNILKVIGGDEYKGGHLSSFTTSTGGIRKGILLPVSFSLEPHENSKGQIVESRVKVPLIQALPIILQARAGTDTMQTNLEIVIAKDYDGYVVRMPANKAFSKYYAEDQVLVAFMENKFNKVANLMRGEVRKGKIENLVRYLQEEYNPTVSLNRAIFESMVAPNLKITEYDDDQKFVQKTEAVLNELTQLDREGEAEIEAKRKQEEAEAVRTKDELFKLEQKRVRLAEEKVNNVRRKLARVNALLELGV